MIQIRQIILHNIFAIFCLGIGLASAQENQTSNPVYSEHSSTSTSVTTEYGPTMRGDTLSKIARQLFPDSSLSRAQIIWAIFLKNPDAFMDGNINKLKINHILKIPSESEIAAIDKSEAIQGIAEQNKAFQAGQTRPPAPTQADLDKIKKLKQELQNTNELLKTQHQESEQLKKQIQELEDQIQELFDANALRDKNIDSLKNKTNNQ
jgi:pilus assembly protein FimV